MVLCLPFDLFRLVWVVWRVVMVFWCSGTLRLLVCVEDDTIWGGRICEDTACFYSTVDVTLSIYVDVCTLSLRLPHWLSWVPLFAVFVLRLLLALSSCSPSCCCSFCPCFCPVPITICLSAPSVTDPILAYPSSGWAVYPFTNPILTNWFRLLRSVAGIRYRTDWCYMNTNHPSINFNRSTRSSVDFSAIPAREFFQSRIPILPGSTVTALPVVNRFSAATSPAVGVALGVSNSVVGSSYSGIPGVPVVNPVTFSAKNIMGEIIIYKA